MYYPRLIRRWHAARPYEAWWCHPDRLLAKRVCSVSALCLDEAVAGIALLARSKTFDDFSGLAELA
jgi:hypothetical protein